MCAKDLEQAKKQALRLLSYRSRTEAEMLFRLKQYGFSLDVVNAVISYLKDCKLIDDRSFAHDWVRYRFKQKKKGKYFLYNELVHKGISTSIAAEAVETISDAEEYEAAYEQALIRVKRNHSWSSVGRYLARQGFPSGVILRIGRSVLKEPLDD